MIASKPFGVLVTVGNANVATKFFLVTFFSQSVDPVHLRRNLTGIFAAVGFCNDGVPGACARIDAYFVTIFHQPVQRLVLQLAPTGSQWSLVPTFRTGFVVLICADAGI